MAQAELTNGVTLEYEIHGDESKPVVLIILGITDNITDWPVGLYQPLVDNGFCVIRYELRDSGLSKKFEDLGVPDLAVAKAMLDQGELPSAGYTIHDVAEDAFLLLNSLSVDSAYILGYSFGSAVAQVLTLKNENRVKGLVCLQGSNYAPNLPTRLPEVDKAMVEATFEYSTTVEKRKAISNLRIATNGSIHALDENEAKQSAITSVERAYYPQGTARIVLSRFATEPFYQQTQNIQCPTLILHADEDPIFSIEHGEDMAKRIPNAELVVLEGAGHNHPLSLQPIITNELIKFFSSI
jgi:pimeloyl-ACP methyl ester carboxylesterase